MSSAFSRFHSIPLLVTRSRTKEVKPLVVASPLLVVSITYPLLCVNSCMVIFFALPLLPLLTQLSHNHHKSRGDTILFFIMGLYVW